MILAFLFRMRRPVLALLALATAVAAFVAFHGHAAPVGALFLTAASVVIGALLAFVHLRHAGLAALVALAPLPGMLAAGPFAIASGVSFSGLLAVYGFAYLAASCLTGDIVRRVLDAMEPVAAARAAPAQIALPMALGVFVGAVLSLGWLFGEARLPAVGAGCELLAAGLSVLAFVPLAAALLPFGEAFFVSANRARERRGPWLRRAGLVAERRWGFSLGGAALVLATLGGFEAGPSHSAALAQLPLLAAFGLLVFLTVLVVSRDWRDTLAATLALAVLAIVSVFLWGRATRHLGPPAVIEIACLVALGLLIMLRLAVRCRVYRQSGDASAVARLRAIEDIGLAPWFGALGAAGAAVPWIVLHGSIATLVAAELLAAGAALLAMPAIATALDALVPRWRSLDELYGRG